MKSYSPSLSKRLTRLSVSIAFIAYRWLLHKCGFGRAHKYPIVITYHGVRESDLGRFVEQMRWLVKLFTPVFADQLDIRGDSQQVAVTFDDAFDHIFEAVLPQLAAMSIPATVFVPTGHLGHRAEWIQESGGTPYPDLVVSAATLAGIDKALVRLGSHSVTHAPLAKATPDQLMAELEGSKRTLERVAGCEVKMLALPYGSCSPSVLAAARMAGYDQIFANVPIGESAENGSLLVGRVNVSPADWLLEFRLKLAGGYNWMAATVPAKRGLLRFLGSPANS